MHSNTTKSLIVLALVLLVGGVSDAFAATPLRAEDIKLADGVSRMSAYEPPTTKYVVANSTDILSDVKLSSKVTGHLERGQEVSVLAVPRDWDWLLVGRDGIGIGYIPRGAVAPAHQFRSS
jgi:hypothetical protein